MKNRSRYPILRLTLLITVVVCSIVACRKVIPDTPASLPIANGTVRDSSGVHHDSTAVKHDSTATKQDSTALKHDSTPPKVDTPAVPPPYPQAPLSSCYYAPNYGDTIIYPQPTSGSDYIVHPVNSPGPGHYFSWPVGMILDSTTGAINVTRSETGLKYALGFVKAGTTDTCIQFLTIGGAAYMDSVYVINAGQTSAAPYFEANPTLLSVCQGGGCAFDVTGSAAHQKVIVDPSSGVIDLKKTLNGTILGLGGAFGLLPVNGQTITTTIYYRLTDPSNQALQHIDVQIMYYDKKSIINGGLLGGIVNKLDNLLSGNLISMSTNPRPPLIIITRNY